MPVPPGFRLSYFTRREKPSAISPIIGDIETMAGGIRDDSSIEDLLKIQNAYNAAKGNITRANTLEQLGGDPQAAMAPAYDKPQEKSFLQGTLHALDTPGAAVREKLFKFAGMPTYTDDRLYGSDLVRYLQKKWLGEDKDTIGQRLTRGVGGLAIDVVTDPLTYLTFGAGAGAKIGGKALTKEGAKVFKLATKGAKGEKAFQAGVDAIEKASAARKAALESALPLGKDAIKAANKANKEVLKGPATRFMGQKIAPDPFHYVGKAGKAGYEAAKRFSNPIENKLPSYMQRLAGDIVDAVENVGTSFSTKAFMPDWYLKTRRAFNSELGLSRSTVKDGVQQLFTNPKTGKFASEQERKIIATAIDEGRINTLPDDLRSMATNVKVKFDELGFDLLDAGILKHTLDDYIPHVIAKDVPKHLRRSGFDGGGLSAGIGGRNMDRARFDLFTKTTGEIATKEERKLIRKAIRKDEIALLPEELRGVAIKLKNGETSGDIMYKTFEDLFAAQPELRLLTEGDAAKALANYWAVAERAKATKKFLDGVSSMANTEGTSLTKKIQLELDDFVSGGTKLENLPRNVVKDLKRIDKPWDLPDNIITRGYKNAHKAFKTMVTVVAPAFHGRNFASNKVLGYLGAGSEMLDPRVYVETARVLGNDKAVGRGLEKVLGMTDGIKSRNGVTYGYDEVLQLAKERGVIKSDWAKDAASVVELPSLKNKLNPANWGGKVGQGIETEGRVTNFIANLKRGLSPDDAAKAVDEALFDYADLTSMDRMVKWVVPFYTFMKKNAELHAKALLKNPGRITNELRFGSAAGEAVTGGTVVPDEDLQALPEYFQEGLKIAREVDDKTAVEVLSGMGLPIEDIGELPIFALLRGDISRAGQKAFSRVSPVLKAPAELIFGIDSFFGTPLEPGTKTVNADGTMSYPYTKAYPILKKMPQFVQDFLQFKEIKRGDEMKYEVNPYRLKALEAMSLGVAGISQKLSPVVFMRYYRDIGKLTDPSKSGDARLLDFLSGIRIHELPDAGSLKEQAATGRTYQVQNLLNESLKRKKNELGIPRGL